MHFLESNGGKECGPTSPSWEKALVRWRTQSKHHHAQDKGRTEILENYHLRVGEVQYEMDPNEAGGRKKLEQTRLDETETGTAKIVSLVKTKLKPLESTGSGVTRDVKEVLQMLNFDPHSTKGLASWDAFEAILSPGDVLFLCSWIDPMMAEQFSEQVSPSAHQIRQVRIIRDYGMFDRTEAPQYYPEVKRTTTVES